MSSLSRPAKPTILVISHSFPPFPQRFTLEEVETWRALGFDLEVLSLRRPRPFDKQWTPELQQEAQRTIYLRELRWRAWMRGVVVALRHLRQTLYVSVRILFGRHLRFSSLRIRLHDLLVWGRCIGALGVAAPRNFDIVHADFADAPATVAWAIHKILGPRLTFRDHFSYNPQLLDEKIRAASVVLTCSDANTRFLRHLDTAAAGDQVVTSYLGVDCRRWQPMAATRRDPPIILCVGRLQEKKGQGYLLQALLELRRIGWLDVDCILAGDGPDRPRLQRFIQENDLGEVVTITGYLHNRRARELMEMSTVHCLPSVVTERNDCDGIPIALMESMALGIPTVATPVGGIAELIDDRQSGLLVPERDSDALARALNEVLTSPELALRVAAGGAEKVRDRFNADKNYRLSAKVICSRTGFGVVVSGR